MKKSILTSLLTLPLLISTSAHAQRHHYEKGYGHSKMYQYTKTSHRYHSNHRPDIVKDEQVDKMVNQLKGTGNATKKKRTIELHSTIAPRGLGDRKGRFDYEVDASCHLATTEVKFVQGSTSLADRSSSMYLRKLAQALLDPNLARGRFVIEGHASAEGSHHANKKLSQSRANAIYDYLVGQGVPPHRLIAIGHGENQARFPSISPEYLLAQDRRVMVYKLIR